MSHFLIHEHYFHIRFILLAFLVPSSNKDWCSRGRKWIHAHTNTHPDTPIGSYFFCATWSVEMIYNTDMAWQWRANAFEERDWAGSVKAPSIQFRSWNAEDNCPGKGSPTPAENSGTELTFLVSLPAEIKSYSSGPLLA